jgi:DNA-binding XRE family transcriptional regulator
MYIDMSNDQAQRLASFLKRKRALKELELERNYDWKEMAEDIGLSPELLRKLKDGKSGMHLDTAIALAKAFGPEVLDVLGIPRNNKPTFTTKE